MTPFVDQLRVIIAAPLAAAPASGLSPATAALWSASIAAAVALALFVLKDVVLARLNESRATKRSEALIYRRYLAPLADACTKLVWRANEIFVDERHAYLKTTTRPLDFNAYKRRSTLYRVAALIGWVRAMNIELAALTRTGAAFASPIAEDIKAFQSALADGPHVEIHRLKSISALWGLDLTPLSDSDVKTTAMRFEVTMHHALTGEVGSDDITLDALTPTRQAKVCAVLATFLTDRLGVTALTQTQLKATVAQAVRCLTFREALVYRDWQDALGDAMLTPDPDAERRYKLIGYEAFETLLAEKTPWVRVFAASIDDIDFEDVDPNDFRAHQLARTMDAAARLLVSLSTTENKDLVDTKTLETARALRTALDARGQI